MAKILIVKSGTTNPPVVSKYGDYDTWFKSSLSKYAVQWHVVSVYEEETLPDPGIYDGVIITGSPSSVWEEAPWMTRTIAWLHQMFEHSMVPLLGVCFGHQLLARALGADVIQNPKGPEYGTISVALNDAGRHDPLFNSLPSTIRVQSIHSDIAVNLPGGKGVIPLGASKNTALQAFALGENIRAVQFHPEITEPILSLLFTVREIDAKAYRAPHGHILLANWFQHWISD